MTPSTPYLAAPTGLVDRVVQAPGARYIADGPIWLFTDEGVAVV
jgi:hypothetical protein